MRNNTINITKPRTDVLLQSDIWTWIVDIWVWITVNIDYYVYIGIEYAIYYYPPCYDYVTWIGYYVFGIPYSSYSYASASAAASASSSASSVVVGNSPDVSPTVVIERANDAPGAFDLAGPNTFLIFVLALVAIVALAAIVR